jgi:ribose-phosphate pyrophosphokinase
MIRLKINGTPIDFTTSKFPDGTSQVWKFEKLPVETPDPHCKIDFIWENNESEVMQLFMLLDLVQRTLKSPYIYLNIPYLPYARQDKVVAPDTTFALHTFAKILNGFYPNVVTVFDGHSSEARHLIQGYHSISPRNFHAEVNQKFRPDFVFYPDKGAAARYTREINEIVMFGEKVRNQRTGEIERYEVCNSQHFEMVNKRALIVDDICDGGATFIEAARALKRLGVGEIGLCVSHGLFSKGLDELKAAGISQFFTTNSLLKNEDGYNVWK